MVIGVGVTSLRMTLTNFFIIPGEEEYMKKRLLIFGRGQPIG